MKKKDNNYNNTKDKIFLILQCLKKISKLNEKQQNVLLWKILKISFWYRKKM